MKSHIQKLPYDVFVQLAEQNKLSSKDIMNL